MRISSRAASKDPRSRARIAAVPSAAGSVFELEVAPGAVGGGLQRPQELRRQRHVAAGGPERQLRPQFCPGQPLAVRGEVDLLTAPTLRAGLGILVEDGRVTGVEFLEVEGFCFGEDGRPEIDAVPSLSFSANCIPRAAISAPCGSPLTGSAVI